MKLLSALIRVFSKQQRVLSSLEDYKQQALIQNGKAQFEKLLKKGLSVPVALL